MENRGPGIENLRLMRQRQKDEDDPPNRKHGVYGWLNDERLPGHIREHLDGFSSGLIADLGGDTEVTTAQRALVDSTCVAMGVILLSASWVASNGAVIKPTGKPQPVLQLLAAYLNTLRLNLLALGLERRSKSANTLESVIGEYTHTTEATPDAPRP